MIEFQNLQNLFEIIVLNLVSSSRLQLVVVLIRPDIEKLSACIKLENFPQTPISTFNSGLSNVSIDK